MTRFIGQRIVYLGMFLVCLTRVIAYSPVLGGPSDSSGPMFLTGDGRTLWFYVVLWGIGAVLSMVGLIRGKGSVSVLWFVWLMLTWAGGYFGAWVSHTGPKASRAWMSAALYGGNAVIALGVFYMARALEQKRASDITAVHDVVRRDE